MPLTPEEDAQLGEVQRAHTDPAAYSPPGEAISGTVAIPKAGDGPDKTGWRGTVLLKGREFRLADEIGAMPLLIWASVAEMSTADNRALAAIYSMLKDCVHEEHWAEFQMHAIITKAKTEELLDIVTKALEALTANPTGPSSAASGGSPRTSGASRASSSSARARKSRT